MYLTTKLIGLFAFCASSPTGVSVAEPYLQLRPPVHREPGADPSEWINPFLRPSTVVYGGPPGLVDPLDHRVEALSHLQSVHWGARLSPHGDFGGLVIANRRIVRVGEKIEQGGWAFELLRVGERGLDLRVTPLGEESWTLEDWDHLDGKGGL